MVYSLYLNGLHVSFIRYTLLVLTRVMTLTPILDFGKPAGTILGLIGSMYALGVSDIPRIYGRELTLEQAILSVPFVPIVADRYGRRRCVQTGCAIMFCGAALRMFLPRRWRIWLM
jgi:MFS family permease